MYKQVDRVIKGKKVIVSKFPARRGLKLQVRLAKVILPIIPSGKADSISSIASGLASLDDENVLDLVLKLLSQTQIDNQVASSTEVFDVVFSGEYDLLFDVLKFVMEVNYKSFLEKMGVNIEGEARVTNSTPRNDTK